MKIFSTNKCKKFIEDKNEFEIIQFQDGEILAKINVPLRNEDVIIIGSTKEHTDLMEVLFLSDACKRAGCNHITLIVPYLSYMRQDRRGGSRVSHGSRVIANMIEASGIKRVIAFDVHASQIDGCYNIPFDNIPMQSIYKTTLDLLKNQLKNPIICSPDAGGIKRAESMNIYDWNLVFCSKTRKEANIVSSMQLIGDVKNKDVIIIDDMIDTGGTICKCADLLKEHGASSINVIVTHGLFNGKAIENIRNSKIDHFYYTDTTNKKINDLYHILIQVEIKQTVDNIIKSITNNKSLKEFLYHE